MQTQVELERSNAELRRFNRAVVGRELGKIELKRQVNELSQQVGKVRPHDASFVEAGCIEPEEQDVAISWGRQAVRFTSG